MQALPSWQLFALCVLTWGTTWYAITWQIDATAPEVGVAWRFTLAAAVVLAAWAARGGRLRFGAAQHLRLAAQGAFMFSLSYVAIYHAERHVPSGLVAVGYAASPLVNGLGAHWLFGAPLARRFVAGGVAGVAGVALIFAPQFRAADATGAVALGAALTVLAVLLSSAGSLIASRNRERQIPFWPALGYGMAWGALLSWALVAVAGHDPLPPATWRWWAALGYLALAGSVLTFAAYLSLLDRLGPGRSSAIGVMTPLLALAVSVAFEGYRPDLAAALGAALAVTGNVMMLRRDERG
ncbi:MAG: DMT family transporter [Gammaproteobacteria bacterium]